MSLRDMHPKALRDALEKFYREELEGMTLEELRALFASDEDFDRAAGGTKTMIDKLLAEHEREKRLRVAARIVKAAFPAKKRGKTVDIPKHPEALLAALGSQVNPETVVSEGRLAGELNEAELRELLIVLEDLGLLSHLTVT